MGYTGSKYRADAFDDRVAAQLGLTALIPTYTSDHARAYYVRSIDKYYVATGDQVGTWTNKREIAVEIANGITHKGITQPSQLSLF